MADEILNLDENAVLLVKSRFIQDFREVYSRCELVFPLEASVDFSLGSLFLFSNQEWEVVSYKRILLNSCFFHSVVGFPRGVCAIVKSKSTTLAALARDLDISFNSEFSSDLKFEFPLRNVPLGALLYKYRHSSFERHRTNLSQAFFLFYDHRGLIGRTYNDISKGTVQTYDADTSAFFGGTYSFIGDLLYTSYNIDHRPKYMRYKNYINIFIGDKFDFDSMYSAVLGSRYNITGKDADLFSAYDNLILVRQEFNSEKGNVPWKLTFGQLLIK